MFSFFTKIATISTKELENKIKEGIILLDVRTPQEFRSGHISQSKNVPLNKINSYQGAKKETYIICQSGMRSKQAAKMLKKKGYDVINVRGGMNAWTGPIRGGK